MKILKYLLSLVLIVLIMLLFGVMFSSNIVSYMTKTKHSEFENVKFSIKKPTFFEMGKICYPHIQ